VGLGEVDICEELECFGASGFGDGRQKRLGGEIGNKRYGLLVGLKYRGEPGIYVVFMQNGTLVRSKVHAKFLHPRRLSNHAKSCKMVWYHSFAK